MSARHIPPDNSPPRIRVRLDRLPRGVQYSLAVAVVVAVGWAAWLVGRDRPVPSWITNGLIPVLGVGYIVLVIVAVVARVRSKGHESSSASGGDGADS